MRSAPSGLLMGRFRRRLDGDPWLVVLLNLPALVIIVLAYVWAGLTETAAIAAVALNSCHRNGYGARRRALRSTVGSTRWPRSSA